MTLIREVESLRNGLVFGDPARVKLDLRLADLYFEEYLDLETRKLDPSAADKKRAKSYRRRSLALYKGAIQHAKGKQREKIEFQMARLYLEAGESSRAAGYLKRLAEKSAIVEIRRESALRLAELQEQTGLLVHAEKYFLLAKKLCATDDSCPYIRYRLGWVYHSQGKLEEAIQEIRLSLWDAKGNVREEALRDFLLFLSKRVSDGRNELKEIEALALKLKRPLLVDRLAELFYSNGNRDAGTLVLSHVNQLRPKIDYQIRLLEEHYGKRDWDQYEFILESAETRKLKKQPEDLKKAEKILKRLAIQLDAERKTRPERGQVFQRTVDLYLGFFPDSPLREKMIEGWLAVETPLDEKLARLKKWSIEAGSRKNTKFELRLRKERAHLAQKNERSDILIEECQTISKHLEKVDPKGSREYRYLKANALYKLGKLEEAAVDFIELSKLQGSKQRADQWSVLSLNLLLDIYSQQKKFALLVKKADSWLSQKGNIQSKENLSGEFASLEKIRKEAQFEYASSLGSHPDALKIFWAYCDSGEFLPKSCENAKVLSIELKEQSILISSLKKLNLQKDLVGEYELSGYFRESAQLREKTEAPKTDQEILRLALLYELDRDLKNRDRLLGRIWKNKKKRKEMGESEDLIYLTFRDAGLLSAKASRLPWSIKNQLKLASRLEEAGQGNKWSHKLLLESKTYAGPHWSRLVLEKISKLDKKQRKLRFYGRRSERRFKWRLGAIQKFKKGALVYLEGSDRLTRIRILELLRDAYRDLAVEIQKTPIPKELDEATQQTVIARLEEMSAPFSGEAAHFEKLYNEEVSKKEVAKDNTSVEKTKRPGLSKIDEMALRSYQSTLRTNPGSRAALEGLRKVFLEAGMSRLAHYFEGRLKGLKEGA